MAEHRTHKPGVEGSTPSLATNELKTTLEGGF